VVLLFTGNGKGKTTAALGQMVRVLGRGKRALMIQFIKGPWRSGEDDFAERFKIPKDKFQIKKMGLGFVGILGDKLPRDEHKAAAEKALAYFKEEAAKDPSDGGWHLIILDEINVVMSLGLLAAGAVLAAIKDFPKDRILMLTGRGAPQEFIDAADLATEMKELKHPFQQGEKAKFSVEF